MAYKPVVPEVTLVTLKPLPDRKTIVLQEGGSVEGYYLGVQSHSKVKEGFVLLQGEDGQLMSIINYRGLAWQIARVPVGVMVKIEYNGKKKRNGGREFHAFTVYMDEERRIDSDTASDVLEKVAQQATTLMEVENEEDVPF